MRIKRGAWIPGYILAKGAAFLPSRVLRSIYVILGILFPVLIAIGCWIDGTWTMPGSDKGFSQYYGFWAIFATTPVILLLTSYLFDSFGNSIQRPEIYCANLTTKSRERIQQLVDRHTQSLSLGSRSSWILVFIIIILLFWWLFNVVHTISPAPRQLFHHDVFDSSAHPFGFYITRSYILFVFLLVYCPAIFVALHVTASLISILKFLCRDDMLQINLFHSDNCGGTSPFGKINLIILCIYGNFFAIIYTMYITHHQTYLVITISLIACSFLAVVQSVAAVYYIHKAIVHKKTEYLEAVTARINQQSAASLQPGGKFPNDLLSFRNHLIGINTFPYTSGVLMGVNIIRFMPALLAVLSLFRLYHLR